MTAPPVISCPECGGDWMVGHPAGLLAFRHVDPCSLRDGEDSTQVADAERARVLGAQFIRQATATERAMLAAFPAAVPATLWCRVSFVTGGAAVRSRYFTQKP